MTFKAFEEWLTAEVRRFELKTIIPIVEGILRVWYRLDPRLYSERLRIRSITEGNVAKKSDRYAILALYAMGTLPKFTANVIDAIDRSALNLVIVTNARLEDSTKTELLDQCHLLIERANLGRDFGAYKDAISIVLGRFKNIDRLILLNDSLFYFERGLNNLISRLNGPHEFIGLTEVFEFHYHVQSFALSFGSNVIRSKHFLRFWKKYRPISTRRWSIHKGEVSLTRRMTKAGFRPHIVFQAAELISRLSERPVREVLESLSLLPTYFRKKMYEEYDAILGGDGNPESLAAIEAISRGIRSFQTNREQPSSSILQRISEQAESMERWSFEIFTTKIVTTIAERNQMHTGGFYFMKYLGLSAIKRDIFYRGVYTLEEIHRILTSFNEPIRDEVMADLRRAGTAMHLKGFQRLLYRHGSI
jgi:Rhamnan synthesis protein F